MAYLHWLDNLIIVFYLLIVATIGFLVKQRATKQLDSYFLADRNVPWWMLGLSGCSSYIDIGGTMAMVGALYYLGLKAIWVTHIYWGWFIIAFYMAFQAKWIRRSGVMTFAEWNRTRFGADKSAEQARLAAAIFLLALMICNLMYIAVGIGKFAEEFLPIPRWSAILLVFSIVGVYVTLAGFFGVILTDMLQTILIAVGATILSIMAFQKDAITQFITQQHPEWSSLAMKWRLWGDYLNSTPASYHHFDLFGPVVLAGFTWVIFRVLAGPNVWDFQFFLSARSPRDAALAGGMWTLGYTLRWIMGCAFLVLGIYYLDSQAGFDGEKIMPLTLTNLPVGVRGLFLAVLLAALMSTLDAMINVTSSVVVNDFLKRYFSRDFSQARLVRMGQLASALALLLGFSFSLGFKDVISAWETMIFVVVTMILAPATMRWHWWRFSATAFVWSMIFTASFIVLQKLFFAGASGPMTLLIDTLASVVITVIMGFSCKPTDREVLVQFYARIRPFGIWGQIRQEAISRGLVPATDKTPMVDGANGFLSAAFQLALALIPFYVFLRKWDQVKLWVCISILLSIVLYFTWYRTLPDKHET
jgi:solute:Na+ symporter, SSS family